MLRATIFACAVACLTVAAPARAQGNRGNSNGVPGSVSNLEAIVDALHASLGDIAGEVSALKERVIALENAGGGGESRIIWSGGCPTAVTSLFAVLYCTSGVDFDTAAGYVSTDGTGRFTIATPGLYRINFRGRMKGTQGNASINVLPGTGGFYTAATAFNKDTTEDRDVNLDVI